MEERSNPSCGVRRPVPKTRIGKAGDGGSREWEYYANLRFEQVPLGESATKYGRDKADIRVTFLGKAYESRVRNDSVKFCALEVEKNSMRLGFASFGQRMTPKLSGPQLFMSSGTQSVSTTSTRTRKGGIHWNKPAVIAYYSGPPTLEASRD